jgi:hypothetical protein
MTLTSWIAEKAGGFACDVLMSFILMSLISRIRDTPLTKRLTDHRFTHRYCRHEIAFERCRVDRVRC